MNFLRSNDRRSAFRIPYFSPAGYTNEIKFGEGTVRNVSPDGMFLMTKELFNLGEDINIEFQFRNSRKKMKLQGTIVRSACDGFGIKFLWQ